MGYFRVECARRVPANCDVGVPDSSTLGGLRPFTDGMNVAFGKNRRSTARSSRCLSGTGAPLPRGDKSQAKSPACSNARTPWRRSLAASWKGPLVLVFNSQEFRQSNVGVMLGQDEASTSGDRPGGGQQDVRLRDRRPQVRGMREGLAQVLFNQTMYETD